MSPPSHLILTKKKQTEYFCYLYIEREHVNRTVSCFCVSTTVVRRNQIKLKKYNATPAEKTKDASFVIV